MDKRLKWPGRLWTLAPALLLLAGCGAQEGEESGGEPFWQTWPWWAWAIIAGAAVLVIAAVVVVVLLRKRKKDPPPETVELEAEQEGPVVEKLHEQGARKYQQDCFFVSSDELRPTHGLLAVVADGMGGLSNGDKVSQTAVTAVMNGFYTAQGTGEQVLLGLVGQANRAVNLLLGPDGYRTAGSTIVMGLLRGGMFHYLSVGDSRISLYRDGVLYQLNREHIFREELYVRAVNGETSLQEAVNHPKGGGLTSFLGMGQLKYIDLPARPVAVRPGDIFLLMCDGVYNALAEGEMETILAAGGNTADALRQTIQSKGYTNQDNYTAVIIKC